MSRSPVKAAIQGRSGAWKRGMPDWLQRMLALLVVTLSSPVGNAAALGAKELAVIVNDRDPLSVAIADYYVQRRSIPAGNVVHVNLDPARSTLGAKEFATLKASIDIRVTRHVQAFALTWVRPYRVECMSIAAALALGFDADYCGEGCTATPPLLYFNSGSSRPFDDFGIRPTMSIAARRLEDAEALIDRGIAADGSQPAGTAYLVTTDDRSRNVRSALYRDALLLTGDRIRTEQIAKAEMRRKNDVLFYFTGAVEVDFDHIGFLPGAVADHLTSLGGVLDGLKQMSSLRWLEAGATGSYGTVVEPCNITTKFPNPGVLIHRYVAGDTLIEAYWKSVLMPAQGMFIGEPLATPFRGKRG